MYLVEEFWPVLLSYCFILHSGIPPSQNSPCAFHCQPLKVLLLHLAQVKPWHPWFAFPELAALGQCSWLFLEDNSMPWDNELDGWAEISGADNGFVSLVKSDGVVLPVPGRAFSCGCLWQCLSSLSTITQPEGLHTSTCLRETIFTVESGSGWGLRGSVSHTPCPRWWWREKVNQKYQPRWPVSHSATVEEKRTFVHSSLKKAPGFHFSLASGNYGAPLSVGLASTEARRHHAGKPEGSQGANGNQSRLGVRIPSEVVTTLVQPVLSTVGHGLGRPDITIS